MTINLNGNLFEIDDSVSPEPAPEEGMVIVKLMDGTMWNGNTFTNCTLKVPEELLRDTCGRA